MEDNPMLYETIREYYANAYPDDDLGRQLLEDVTFADVLEALRGQQDVYDVIGVGDSIVRERLFARIAELLEVDYDYVYYLWLNGPSDAEGGTGLDDSVRDAYMLAYPDDSMGEDIVEDVTFRDVWKALNDEEDVYELLGVGDSFVREGVFSLLADALGTDYEAVYQTWLHGAA